MTPEAPLRHDLASSHGMAWAAAAGVAACMLVGLSHIAVVLPIALIGVTVIMLIATFRPKAFALTAVLVIVFATLIKNMIGPAGSYAEEGMIAVALLAFSARRLVSEGRLVWLPGTGWYAGYLALGMVSSFLADVPPRIAAQAAFIAVKGVVFAFALAQLHWTRDDLVVVVRFGIAAAVTMVASALLNLALPGFWAQLTTGGPPISYMGPIPALNGLFQHPAAFSRFCGVLAVAGLVYGLVVRRSLANTVLVVASGGLAFLTFQVKSIVGLIATLATVGSRFLRPAVVAGLLCAGPIIAAIVVPPLFQLIGSDVQTYVFQDSARSELTRGGATLAAQYFPFGAGFGRFGSSTAADFYSPLYYQLGFAHRFGLSPDSDQFLNDTQWPAIYGETGWFGTACFVLGMVSMLVCLLRRSSPDEEPLVRWIRITGVGWMILLLVESAAGPVFVSPPSFPFVFAAAGIAASFRSAARSRWPIAVRTRASSAVTVCP